MRGKLHTDFIAGGHMSSEERVDRMRRTRVLQQVKQAEEQEMAIEREREQQELMRIQQEQEQALAQALAKKKEQEVKDQKTIQQIREQSAEIRDLEVKLRAAYTNKEREAQIAEQNYIKEKEKKEDQKIFREMEKVRLKVVEQEHQKVVERKEKGAQAKKILEEQISQREEEKQFAYQEFLKEKLLIDQIVKKIQMEDEE